MTLLVDIVKLGIAGARLHNGDHLLESGRNQESADRRCVDALKRRGKEPTA